MIGRRAVLGAAAGLLVPRIGQSHPYHVSTADVRRRGGALEVTLEVSPEDLQEAVRRNAGKDVDIDDEAAVSLIRAYLRDRFVVRGPEGPIPMVWVGCEIELEAAWLYFEYEAPGSLRHYTLFDGVFFDIAPAQVNRVLVRRGKATRTLRFRPGDRPQRLG